MPTYDNKSIRQKNGEIVMDALKQFNEPVTLTDVVRHIADSQQLQITQIKEPVKSVLQKGVEYGFIQKMGSRYTADLDTIPDTSTTAKMVSATKDRVRKNRRPKPLGWPESRVKKPLKKR